VQVVGADAHLLEVVGEVFGHALGESGHECPLALGDAAVDLRQEVVDLALGGADGDGGIDEAGGADDLLHDVLAVLLLVGAGCGRDENSLIDHALELGEGQWAVVTGRGEAEPVLHQHVLARTVASVHASHLGQGDVGLVDDRQVVVGEIVEQRRGLLARFAP
jgi:hypothetical protein